MKAILTLCMFLICSCREFYDDEFLEDEATRANQTQTVSYSASLNPTDSSLTQLNGEANINIDNGDVTINLSLNGIPQNIIQLHYAYVSADCQTFNIAVPNELGSLRNYTINEVSSTEALAFDLRATGASTTTDDINLENKSLVVRAFSNLSGLPTNVGTNVITIACGEIFTSPVTSQPTTGGGIGTNVTGETLGGTVEGTVGGTIGGTVEGAVGGTAGGINGGTLGGGSFGGVQGGGVTTGGVTGQTIGGVNSGVAGGQTGF